MAVPSRFPLPDAAGDATAAASLAERIGRGDAAAESELVARYRAGVALLLRRRVKDRARAEDLCQEVFRIAIGALRDGRLDDGAKLTAYLWGIARNLVSSERRAAWRAAASPLSDVMADMSPGPDEQLLAAERARMVRDALGRLSPRDRAVLRGFYLSDASKASMCQRLGLTPPQFDVIKWRALKRLQALLLGRDPA